MQSYYSKEVLDFSINVQYSHKNTNVFQVIYLMEICFNCKNLWSRTISYQSSLISTIVHSYKF